MSLETIKIKNETCEVHGKPSRAAHKALLAMVLASLALIIRHVWVYGPTGRATGPAIAAASFPLLLATELRDLLLSSNGIFAELWDIFPYFIVGILLAGYLRTYKIAVKLQASFRRHGFAGVLIATLVGMITPLCACGTITTAVSLLFAGMPLAPVMALLVTSPLLSPTTYLLTLNDLGPEWTVIRTAAAFLMGMFAGTATLLLTDRGFRTRDIFIEGAIPRGDFHDDAYPDERLRCNCREKFGNRVAARTKNMFIVFLAKSGEMLWMVGKYVLVGVAVGTIVERYMPKELIYGLFGRDSAWNVLWVTLGAVPLFLHQIAASSVLYHIKSSLGGTLDAGAGLAFLIGGPVTAMPTMVLFWTIFKKRVFALYLAVCIAGTLIIAYAFQLLVFVPHVDTGNPLLRNVRSLSGGDSAILQKQSNQVQMVMDPGGNGMIAIYSNEAAGHGNIVFDGSFSRLRNGASGQFDNRQYLMNAAEWLERSATSSNVKKILIYHTLSKTGLDRSTLLDVEQKGFSVKVADRQDISEITPRVLGDYSQVWLVLSGPGTRGTLAAAELEALSRFTGQGKGVLITIEKDMEGAGGLAAANQLTSRYGVVFTGFTEQEQELKVSTAAYFFSRASEALRAVLKLVHKA